MALIPPSAISVPLVGGPSQPRWRVGVAAGAAALCLQARVTGRCWTFEDDFVASVALVTSSFLLLLVRHLLLLAWHLFLVASCLVAASSR